MSTCRPCTLVVTSRRMGLAQLTFALLCVALAGAFEDKSVYQYLLDNGYSTLAALMKSAGIDAQLDGSGPFTVFAPSDAVFSRLDPQYVTSLSSLQVKRLASYHVVDGFLLVPQLRSIKDASSKEGQDIDFSTSGTVVVLNNVSTIASYNDIICNNGVIQPINEVLLPPLLHSSNIAGQLIIRDDLFRNSFLYFYFADLTTVLEGGEFTVFAPVDAAWGAMVERILHPRNVSSDYGHHLLIEMMKYHVVPGARTSAMLNDGEALYTLHGYPLHVKISATELNVDTGTVIERDIMASNGVIHAVDKVLFPYDLYTEYLQHVSTGQGAITR